MIAVVCAACQGSAPEPPPAPAAVRVPNPAPADAEAPAWGAPPDAAEPAAPVVPPRTLPAATHGRAIVSVAISDDGSAALTIDAGANVRLWPALDGTREPVAVPMVAPEEMVLAREDGEFRIAALDTAGGLVIVRVDDAGQLVGRVALPFDQPYAQVVAAAGGFLAVRADQTIERIDARGRVLGALAPESGQRVAALVARRGRALALVIGERGVTGRWLDTTTSLAFAAPVPLPAIDPATAVLSPDHGRLAAVQQKTRRAVLVELATGADTPVRGHRTDLVPLGWIAADRVAFAHDEFELSRVEWFDATGKPRAAIGDDFELEFVSVLQMETGDNRVVSFMGHQLVLVEPRRLRYLGYQLHAASRLRATPAGMVASLGGAAELLDATLQIERRVTDRRARDLLPIDDTFALAITGVPVQPGPFDDTLVAPQRKEAGVEIALYEGTERVQVLRLRASELRLHYEPATRLLATVSGTAVAFARFDAATHRFGEPVVVPIGAHVRAVHLLDPAAADGAIALVVHGAKGEPVARPIHEDELTGAPARPAIALPGELEAADRAGHLYVRRDPDTVAIHGPAGELGRITGAKGLQLRPAPDGTRVALFGRGRVILASSDGAPRWSIGFPGVKDVQWTDDELVVLAAGIAKLDPETGATVAARCGWKFGLRSTASFASLAGSTICDR